jgi:hypothetical protein
MSYLKQAQDAYKRRMAGQAVDGANSTADAAHCEISALSERTPVAPASLPPVHHTDDPWVKPTAPCMVCGQVRWRVWCHDERKVWQWICNGCRPLVVINPDGTRWRS